MVTHYLLGSVISGFLVSAFVLYLAKQIIQSVPVLTGPVFVPSTPEAIETMIKLAKLKPGDRVADLGSGDGELVLAVARKGVSVEGYEINPLLVHQSHRRIRAERLSNLASVHTHNFWNADFSRYSVIMIYGASNIMKNLETQLLKHTKPGTRIISNNFSFPNWKPKTVEKNIYLYIKE
jgi:protein-L-isoaspartate O-methyltransferase